MNILSVVEVCLFGSIIPIYLLIFRAIVKWQMAKYPDIAGYVVHNLAPAFSMVLIFFGWIPFILVVAFCQFLESIF